ncbi:hypothetical protein [Paenimyroides aestuarii]|uniref:Outer membrane protein beta-barrel domain-containing protein n=1 Tax=Paenimyroides aestuarii TaxID=2968490 RepID=A0ABY5NPK6_9FLAO|nr:hypothetical protein [Paenimyroides aestuarii]UUV20485.1 hypothetical protein NPX36_08910 [Paenimyroides aestuarii]
MQKIPHLLILSSILCFSQNENKNFGQKKQWEFRAGLGVQKSLFTEAGIAYHKANYSDVGFYSQSFYSAVEYSFSGNIYAIKAGYEINTMMIATALETKYQTNFCQNDFVITPKIGVGLFGDMMLYYGYNISTNHNPFQNMGRHQFSLIANIGKGFLKYH